MSLRLFATMFVFSIAVLLPIHQAFDDDSFPDLGPPTQPNSSTIYPGEPLLLPMKDKGKPDDGSWNYLWAYLVFTWFFSLLTIYFMNAETFKVVKIRQDYLGTQSTVTDRTFRLTGIPKDLRAEDKIKDLVENLEIGHVRSVNLCRNWAEIDGLMVRRRDVLHKLEEAWSAYRSQESAVSRATTNHNTVRDEDGEGDQEEHGEPGEDRLLLPGDSLRSLIWERPKIRLRFGFLKMRNRKIEYDFHNMCPRWAFPSAQSIH